MKWLLAVLLVILICEIGSYHWRFIAIIPMPHDFYFDRVAGISLNVSDWKGNGKENLNVAIGVWITPDRLLTSYNPFRSILQNKTLIHLLVTTGVIGRSKRRKRYFFQNKRNRLACGRQVHYLSEEQILKDNLWHGPEKRNCPLHDLAVFRIYGYNNISHLTTKDFNVNTFPDDDGAYRQETNIFLTELAQAHEQMGPNFKYAEMSGQKRLLSTEFDPDDDGVVDCDDWLPREWGHFICIRNKKESKMTASSAFLVSDEKLFGVGSFSLFRGEQSILVFTDVRPYYDLIFKTCTYAETNEQPPAKWPDTIFDIII